MDFSESYRFSGPAPLFSPDGKYLAIVVEYRLAIRDADTLKVVQLYSCLDKIHQIEWSSDSCYVLCALHSRAIVQVWSVDEPEWTCKIDEGPAGVSLARWTPSGRSVFVVAEFNVRSSVWSLTSKSCTYLKGPKSDKAVCFSPDNQHMALIERSDCKDFLCIYECSDWSLSLQLQTDTSDAAGVAWSPDSQCIVVWDSLLSYKVVVYTREGQCLAAYAPYQDALGVRSVTWAPGGQFLALGSYDQVCRLLNHVTWTPLLECEHVGVIAGPPSAVVYKEVEEYVSLDDEGQKGTEVRSKYVICELPAHIPAIKPALDKPNPKIGVAFQQWSPGGQYLVTINENMPTAAWVWDITHMQLAAVLLHTQPIKVLAWAPDGVSLATCTGSTRVYLWSPAGASIVHIPLPTFQAHSIRWNTNSRTFLLADRDALCCAYMV